MMNQHSIQRIFVECGDTRACCLNTGIQRVVRNIVRYGQRVSHGTQFSPVVWGPAGFTRCSADELRTPIAAASTAASPRGLNRLKAKVKKRLVKMFYPRTIGRAVSARWAKVTDQQVQFRPGDLLLMPDATWNQPHWDSLQIAKRQGAQVGVLVHDLIPLSYPQFFQPELVERFDEWARTMLHYVDFFMTVSRVVRDDVRRFVHRANPSSRTIPVEAITNGCDLDAAGPVQPVREEVRRLFGDQRTNAPFIMVGTMEPRKNHAVCLDAFEMIWRRSRSSRFLIAGRVGWKSQELTERIQKHPLYGHNLFHFQDLNDSEIEFAYRWARASIFPSFVEGFGLPIVESLQFGCQVLASDTPIHREVGTSFCSYFNPLCPRELADQIELLEAGGTLAGVQPPEAYVPHTWLQAAGELLEKSAHVASRLRATHGPSARAA